MKDAILRTILVFGVILPLIGCRGHTTDADIENISLSSLRAIVDRAKEDPGGKQLLLIDPRSPSAFARSHIVGARNIQISDIPIEPRLAEVEAFRTLVVYGDNPASAPAIAMTKRLITAGYDDPLMFRDGLDAWKRAGFEIEGSEAAPAE